VSKILWTKWKELEAVVNEPLENLPRECKLTACRKWLEQIEWILDESTKT